MAKSKFHSVKLLRGKTEPFITDANCRYFVFQQINDDDDKSEKDFLLGFYAIDKDGKKLNADYISLSKTDGHVEQGKKRNLFGNMVISRVQLEKLFKSSDPLVFIPRKWGHYIAYTIQAAALAPYELDPSPPAPPPTGDIETESD
jgi:hypothetical protein